MIPQSLSSEPRVLIIDESAESCEVLGTLLARQGAQTVQARSVLQAVELAQDFRPDIIVFDAESDHSKSRDATRELAATADTNDTPIIILGTATIERGSLPTGQFVSKPYHYGPLIRRIEGLLAAG